MNDPLALTQIQYELAMATGASLDMQSMLRTALGAFLRKLTCTAGGVHLLDGTGALLPEPVYTSPRRIVRQPLYAMALDRLRAENAAVAGTDGEGGYFHAFPLPDAGALILLRRDSPLEPVVVHALQPLMAKLAAACRACRQNETLHATSQRLSSLVYNLQAGVLVEDERRRVVLANTTFCRMFRVPAPPETLLGADCTLAAAQSAALFSDPDAFLARIDTLLDAREPVANDELRTLDGRILERDYVPIFSEEAYLGHLWFYRDVTERRQAAEQMRAVLNTVGEGILTVDQNGVIVMVNQEVQRIFGYPREELLGHGLAKLMPESYRDAHRAGMNRYMTSGQAVVLGKRVEMEGLRKDGTVFPLELHIDETRLPGRRLFTASLRDITRRKEYERMRDDFVAAVSHELRTPLTAIMGWTEALLSESPGPLTDLQKRFLTINYESSQRLNRLIEEILTVSRIQRDTLKLDKAPFPANRLLADVQARVQTLADDKRITIHYQEETPADLRVVADQGRLEQVLGNFISNAIKFSPKESTITVESTVEDGPSPHWRVAVHDTGIGIPEEDLERIFQRFYRARNASQGHYPGTGLGLYICKAIVEGHEGCIDLESQEGQGTIAWFTIPLTP